MAEEKKKVVVWADGCFDMMHYGHANALRQAKQLGDYLIVGVHSDEDITKNKGPPVMKEQDRYKAAAAIKWVDEVVAGAPFVTSLELLKEHNVDICVHGDDIITDADGNDCYSAIRDAGMFKTVPRTKGVSTTDLVGRMLLMTKHHHTTDDLINSSDDVHSMDSGACKVSPYTRLSKFIPSTRQIVQFSDGKAPKEGEKIGYIDGAFDLFHIGHISILEKAKSLCDFLVVGVHTDDVVNAIKGQNHPLSNLHERVLGVLSCRFVDEVIIGAPFVVDAELIRSQGISVVFYGTEHDVPASKDAVDPYAYVKEAGIAQVIESPSKITTSVIIDRVIDNSVLFRERNRKKAEKELAEQSKQ